MKSSLNCLLIDGNNLLYRCYYVSQNLSWANQDKVIFLFLRVMISLVRQDHYQKMLIFFDQTKTNFRQQIRPTYKGQRLPFPSDLLRQKELLQDLLQKIQIAFAQLANFEADDLIASFLEQNLSSGWQFTIFSQDKDLNQLLNLQVEISRPKGKKTQVFQEKDFWQQYRFTPASYRDYLSLVGDSADNIAGIKGIGPQKAQQLIEKFQTLENLYQQKKTLPASLEKLLVKNQDLVYQNKLLITLKKDLNLAVNWEKCNFSWTKLKNNPHLQEFCQKSQFKSILKLLKA